MKRAVRKANDVVGKLTHMLHNNSNVKVKCSGSAAFTQSDMLQENLQLWLGRKTRLEGFQPVKHN